VGRFDLAVVTSTRRALKSGQTNDAGKGTVFAVQLNMIGLATGQFALSSCREAG
jgi:hypothetical protein